LLAILLAIFGTVNEPPGVGVIRRLPGQDENPQEQFSVGQALSGACDNLALWRMMHVASSRYGLTGTYLNGDDLNNQTASGIGNEWLPGTKT
jgi:hypothetical protein